MVLDPIPQSLPVHFFGSRPQPPTSLHHIYTQKQARIISKEVITKSATHFVLFCRARHLVREKNLYMQIYLNIYLLQYNSIFETLFFFTFFLRRKTSYARVMYVHRCSYIFNTHIHTYTHTRSCYHATPHSWLYGTFIDMGTCTHVLQSHILVSPYITTPVLHNNTCDMAYPAMSV